MYNFKKIRLILILVVIIFLCLFVDFKLNFLQSFTNNAGVNEIFVYRCHATEDKTLKALDAMIEDVGRDRTFILFDDDDGKRNCDIMKERVGTDHVILHSNNMCKKINSLHTSLLSSVETPLVIIWRHVRNIDLINIKYIWLIENDVCYDGNLMRILDNQQDSDFIGTWICFYNDNKTWVHWDELEGEIKSTPLKNRASSFFPVTRYSSRFLDIIEDNLGKSGGFCEVYLPTLARINGLSMSNLDSSIVGTPFVSDNHLHHKNNIVDLMNVFNSRDKNEKGKLFHKCT